MKFKMLMVVLIVFMATSCEDFLVEKVFSFSSAESLFTSEKNAELAITGVYDVLNASNIQATSGMYQPLWGRGMHYLTNLGLDEAIGNTASISDAQLKQCANYTYNPESKTVEHAWFALYVGVNRANNVIKYVPEIEGMDLVRKNEMVAEARFFRGFYLTYLTWLFGAVPVPTDPSASNQAPRESLDKVYEQIIADLNYAYQNLPNRNKNEGRINKFTAGTMLAKVYLHLASSKENDVKTIPHLEINGFDWVDKDLCYGNAETICKDIYDNSLYILHPNYKYLFIGDTPAAKPELKKEAMMIMQTGIGGYREFFLVAFLTLPQGSTGANGGGYGWMRGMGEIADKYDDVDLRKAQNITGNMTGSSPTETLFGAKYFLPIAVNSSGNNYCLGKFRQSDPAGRAAIGVAAASGILDFGILRFADVVLMYAEAAYKNGKENFARSLLSEIRLRATEGNVLDASTLDNMYYKANFMDELMDERSRELCGECWRRFDLMRWGKLEQVVANIETTTANGKMYYWNSLLAKDVKDNFQSYKMWYPVPKREIEVNPNLVQNPGYYAE